MMRAVGEMPEWPNGTDSKSVVPSPVPRVRIPISPPSFKTLINQAFTRVGLEKYVAKLCSKICSEYFSR